LNGGGGGGGDYVENQMPKRGDSLCYQPSGEEMAPEKDRVVKSEKTFCGSSTNSVKRGKGGGIGVYAETGKATDV